MKIPFKVEFEDIGKESALRIIAEILGSRCIGTKDIVDIIKEKYTDNGIAEIIKYLINEG